MNFRNSRGMSYIEVLVSAAILTVIIIPLTVGFRQTSVSFLRTQDIYIAGTNCSNILLSAERALKNGLPVAGGTIEDFLDDEHFAIVYDLERFDYSIQVSEIIGGGEISDGQSYSTGSVIPAEVDTEITGMDFSQSFSLPSENLFGYDGGFYNVDCPYAEFSGDVCRISVDYPDVPLNFDARALDSPVTIKLQNNAPGFLSLNIFSDGDSENIQDLVTIESSGTGATAVCFRTADTGTNYLLTVCVYDKAGRLLNRLAKLV